MDKYCKIVVKQAEPSDWYNQLVGKHLYARLFQQDGIYDGKPYFVVKGNDKFINVDKCKIVKKSFSDNIVLIFLNFIKIEKINSWYLLNKDR